MKRIELDFQTLTKREELFFKNLCYYLFESSLNFAQNFHANKGGQRKEPNMNCKLTFSLPRLKIQGYQHEYISICTPYSPITLDVRSMWLSRRAKTNIVFKSRILINIKTWMMSLVEHNVKWLVA